MSVVNPKSALVQLHVAVLLFGVSGLFGKWLSVDPAVIVFGRTLVAALAVAIWLKLSAQSLRVDTRAVGLVVVSGAVLALHWGTFFQAIQISTVAIGLIGFSTFPLFVTFMEPVLSGAAIRRVDIASALLVLLGLWFVAPGFDLSDGGTLGLVWAILSGALFAVLTLLNRRLVAQYSVLPVSMAQQAVAALCTLPWIVVLDHSPQMPEIALLLLLGVLCTALPHVLFVLSLRSIKAQLASVVAGLEPVYGIALAAVFLQEIPELSTVVGAAIVFTAVVLAMRAHKP